LNMKLQIIIMASFDKTCEDNTVEVCHTHYEYVCVRENTLARKLWPQMLPMSG